MGRLITIGDIHGQYSQLLDLIEKLELRKGDELFFLGDLVDYGPQTADVIEYLIDLHRFRKTWHILGNHDAWFLDYLESGQIDELWWPQGGKETLESYGEGYDVPESHVEFLRMASGPIKVEAPSLDREYVLSHGFLCPTKPIESRFNRSDALWGRPSSFQLPTGYFPKNHGWQENQFLVCGHTIVNKPTFYGDHALLIDTGAKIARPITAAILPKAPDQDWEFIQA